MQKKKISKVLVALFWIILGLFFILAVIIEKVCDWFNIRFGVSIEELLFTLASPLEGSDVSFLEEAVEYVMPSLKAAFLILAVAILIVILIRKVIVQISITIGKVNFNLSLYRVYQVACLVSVVMLCFNSVSYAFESLELGDYIARKRDKTTIYEDYYVDPNDAVITSSENPKNLIYIYLESMENTYASHDVGGSNDINYIPNLTQMATENISFSGSEVLGGANITSGAGWTMGALFASTTGIPFSFPVEGNSMDNFDNFAPGVTSLGEILEQYGYEQVFLCGSDGTFAGRESYFTQHGNYDVIDYYDAIDKGYIDPNYRVWWGYEDQKLYDIAKTELLELAEGAEPFNFTMLTVDTHHVDGYVCENCEATYPDQLGNVLQCADNQIYDFINWCREQAFFEDTVIVITGDHFRMDSSLIPDTAERRVYNCYINSAKEAVNITNRTFTTMDFFPTTLSAMGFEIEGNRLGLGTDLFSDTMTLAEQIGFDVFNEEIGKYSDYYVKNFE